LKKKLQITNLYIDRDALNYPAVDAIRARLNIPHTVVDRPEKVYEVVAGSDDPVETGKQILLLTKNKGAFIRDCPGTVKYTCCDYTILHIGTFCTMECSYCILQSYFHPPVLQLFVNHDDLMASLDSVFSQNKKLRIGTGEFTDSLIWETIYPFADKLISRFAKQTNSILELKTKTDNIKHILDVEHNRKTILSWSLNTERIIKSEERRTSSLNARLHAAARGQSQGYPLAFHFDPMIIYPGCEEEYREVIEKLFSCVSPDNIVWISLGTFRFMPALKSIVEKRFNRSKIVYGEFIKGMDGKMRYFKPLRINFYQKIISYIRLMAPNVMIYFCMEDTEVWEKTIGFDPLAYGGLSHILDESATRHCALTENTG
jgi:spore photoproduct lyase